MAIEQPSEKISSSQKLTTFDSANLEPLKIDPTSKIEFTKLKEDIKYLPKEGDGVKKDDTNYLGGYRNKAFMVVTVGKNDPAKEQIPDKNLLEKIKTGEEIKTQSTGLSLEDVLVGNKKDDDRQQPKTEDTKTS
jgi:hypothetical protein